jgi:LPS sulfotransferase NodH
MAMPVISCVIATTPWSGSKLLARALRATRLVGDPRDYFNPFDVVSRCQEWGLLGPGLYSLPRIPEADFVTRYLNAVTKAAMGRNGVLSFNLPWSHQRWLVRFARSGMPDPPGTVPRSDAKVLESWYPGTRYLYLTCADMAWQAARWYQGRTAPAALGGAPVPGQPPDFQEIRWIETLISRQEQAWETYFEVHGIDVHRIECETLAENPEEIVRGILEWLEPPGSPAPDWNGRLPHVPMPRPAEWLPDYQAERDNLSRAIGVRTEDN